MFESRSGEVYSIQHYVIIFVPQIIDIEQMSPTADIIQIPATEDILQMAAHMIDVQPLKRALGGNRY